MHTKIPARLLAVILSSLLFTACGGGGGGTTPPPPGGTNPPPPPAGNQPPTVAISGQEPVMELSAVTLTANSEDPNDDDLSFAWTQTAGTPVTLAGADSAALSFTAPKVKNSETLGFEVTVSDGEATAKASLDVILEEANGVVYAGIEEVPDVEHVYFHHAAFETPRRLSFHEAAAEVKDVQLVPDHKHVAYTLELDDAASNFAMRLFVTALDGSDTRDLTGSVIEGGNLYEFKVSPNGQWIAFRGDLETVDVPELFVIPVDGNTPRRKVSADIPEEVSGEGVFRDFYWSPDSSKLVFGGELRVDGRLEVFSVSVSDGEPVLLSTLSDSPNSADLFQFTDQDYGAFIWSPDSASVAFLDHESMAERVRVTVASVDGSTKRSIHGSEFLTTSNKVQMAWSAQGQLAFTLALPNAENNARELYVDLPAGPKSRTAAREIDDNGNNVPDGRVTDFQWSPDGTHLAYVLNRTVSGYSGPFIVNADSGQSTRIDGLTDADASTARMPVSNAWLADGRTFVFLRQLAGLPAQIFANNVDNTTAVDISGNTGSNYYGGPNAFHLSPFGNTAAFDADVEEDGMYRVYVASTDGSGRRAISGDGIAFDPDSDERSHAGVVDGGWSPDGTQILIGGDLERDELSQLFVVPADSVDGNDRVRITNLLETDGDGDGIPDGQWTEAVWVGPDAK